MFKLRYYQDESVVATFNYFADGGTGNPVNVLPTGTGKSLIIAEFIKRAFKIYPGTRVMMLTHVKELIENNFETLLKVWGTAPAGIYSAGLRRKDTHMPITYAGIGSVAKKATLFGHIDLIIIDECHLVSPTATTQYQKFIKQLMVANPNLKVVGYTATPFRLGQGMITEGGLFTDICYDASSVEAFNKLIDEGYLAPLVPKQTRAQLDVTDVKKSGGEFILRQLQKAVDKNSVTREALTELLREGKDRKHWLIFATGIDHSNHIVAMLEEMGIAAVSIHSKMTTEARDQAIRDFKSGKVRAAVNNNILTTGFDFPAIDLICMLRPTSSPVLWVQMLGRGTRPADGKKNCLVLDFAGNTVRLGPINDPVLPVKKGKGGGGVAPVRVCPECDTICHASLLACPECFYVFPQAVKINSEAGTGELIVKNGPNVTRFEITGISYQLHKSKKGKPDSLLVTYTAGIRSFSEWVCFEHMDGYSRRNSRTWWAERDMMDGDTPVSIGEALDRRYQLSEPRGMQVWTNKKPYPKIMSFDFTPF